MAGMSFLAIAVGFVAMVAGTLGVLAGDPFGPWAAGCGFLLTVVALLLLRMLAVEP